MFLVVVVSIIFRFEIASLLQFSYWILYVFYMQMDLLSHSINCENFVCILTEIAGNPIKLTSDVVNEKQ